MRRMLLAGAVLVASCASAAAQVVIETPPPEVYVETPYAYDHDTYVYRSSPRVYGYTTYYRDRDADDVVVVRPRHRGGCGAYHYWNGDRCIYMRY